MGKKKEQRKKKKEERKKAKEEKDRIEEENSYFLQGSVQNNGPKNMKERFFNIHRNRGLVGPFFFYYKCEEHLHISFVVSEGPVCYAGVSWTKRLAKYRAINLIMNEHFKKEEEWTVKKYKGKLVFSGIFVEKVIEMIWRCDGHFYFNGPVEIKLMEPSIEYLFTPHSQYIYFSGVNGIIRPTINIEPPRPLRNQITLLNHDKSTIAVGVVDNLSYPEPRIIDRGYPRDSVLDIGLAKSRPNHDLQEKQVDCPTKALIFLDFGNQIIVNGRAMDQIIMDQIIVDRLVANQLLVDLFCMYRPVLNNFTVYYIVRESLIKKRNFFFLGKMIIRTFKDTDDFDVMYKLLIEVLSSHLDQKVAVIARKNWGSSIIEKFDKTYTPEPKSRYSKVIIHEGYLNPYIRKDISHHEELPIRGIEDTEKLKSFRLFDPKRK